MILFYFYLVFFFFIRRGGKGDGFIPGEYLGLGIVFLFFTEYFMG